MEIQKKDMFLKTEKQFEFIDQQIIDIQKKLKVLRGKTFRKRGLTRIGLYELTATLNKTKGTLYSANHYTEQFLKDIGYYG